MIKRYKKNEIDELADILKRDGVISVPTDTVYGICAQMNSVKAYNKLREIKKRSSTKPFPIMCENKNQIQDIAIVDEKSEKLIHAFMPGPITLVLKRKSEIPTYITNGKTTIAVRMATSEVLKELIRKTASPLFMTSANQAGEAICTNLDEIEKACPTLDGILEGSIFFNQGSTIIDCTLDEVKILREGPISIEQIKEAIKKNLKP